MHSAVEESLTMTHQVYQEGNLNDFIALTGYHGNSVLYFGDHVFTDLAVGQLHHHIWADTWQDPIKMGWRTGAIIKELRKEVRAVVRLDTAVDLQFLHTPAS